ASYVRGGVARGAGVLPALGNGPLLDAGCGAGGLVAAAALAGQKATGTDIALRWLIIGARRLEELGLEAELVCADIAAAPFADERFHGLAAIDLFEHVEDQDAAARALARMLVPGGKLYLASANRYTLAPYPLAGLFGVGYLPRGFRARYVRARRGLDTLRFAALQSPAGLRRRLARHGFSQFQLRALAIPPTCRDDLHGLQKILFPLYSRLRVLPVVGRLLARIGPAFEITGTREFTPR
ncbi:MAG TPA: class I SAM-dependent methyltransferase, partial [Aliiroseovarius sp.]|nr:class I SAM-dependent methyltransferase [Aliiroseovarius sp.]